MRVADDTGEPASRLCAATRRQCLLRRIESAPQQLQHSAHVATRGRNLRGALTVRWRYGGGMRAVRWQYMGETVAVRAQCSTSTSGFCRAICCSNGWLFGRLIVWPHGRLVGLSSPCPASSPGKAPGTAPALCQQLAG
eukprot:366234-Chlamydomonas_euryale.AAC.4